MKVEYIRIFAEELGVRSLVDKLIYAFRSVAGEFTYTKRGRQLAIDLYAPEVTRLRKLISKRINKVLPEYTDYEWTVGCADGHSWVKIENPDW